MIKRITPSLTVMAAALSLTACASNWDFESVEMMPEGEAYNNAAKSEYVAIAKDEYSEGDYNDSAYFLSKAKVAAMGDKPSPQNAMERKLPGDSNTALQAAYDELKKLATPKAYVKAPKELARAQAKYDCWLQEQEEGFQSDDINACRMAFEQSLAELKAILAKREDLFVVLPHEDGSVGGIEIDDGKTKVLLDKPLAATRTGAEQAQAFEFEKDKVEKIFGKALESQPIPPKSFTLYFENGTTDLVEASKPQVLKIFQDIDSRKVAEVFVIGHTDRLGSVPSNDKLALARAQSVLEYLTTMGLNRNMMEAAGRGEREPVVTTKDGVAEPKNRRVEINVR